MTKHVRIDTPAAAYIYAVDSEEAALLRFANTVGYGSYTELADTLGKTVDQAKADIIISHVTTAELVQDIVDEAIAADVAADGAEDPFSSVEAYVAWCISGVDGDKARALANLHGLDETALIDALRAGLEERDLDDINAPFADTDVEEVDADDVEEAASEIMRGVEEGITDYEPADAEVLIDFFIGESEDSPFFSRIDDGSAFRVALAKRVAEKLAADAQ